MRRRAVWSLPLVILILLFYHYDIDTRPDGDPVEIIPHDWRLVVLACIYVAMMLLPGVRWKGESMTDLRNRDAAGSAGWRRR